MNSPLFLFSAPRTDEYPWLVVALAIFILTIYTIIHVATRNFGKKSTKIIWLVVLLQVPASAIVYWIFWFINKKRMSLE